MFIILTRTESWSPNLMRIQETLHIVSGTKVFSWGLIGKEFCFKVIRVLNSSILEFTYSWSFIGCCYFLSSAINPFLYSLLSKRFRRGFHDLSYKLIKKWRKKSPYSSCENQNNRPELVQAKELPNNFSFCLKDRQVHNRNALKRHFNLPISSVVQSDMNCRYRVVFKSQSSRQKTTLIVNKCEQTPILKYSGINDLRKVGSESMSLVASTASLSIGTQTKVRQKKFYSISEEKPRKSNPFLSTLSCQTCGDAYML